jgi:hypothetical protein
MNIIKEMANDNIMKVGLVFMVNGLFYSVLIGGYGEEFANEVSSGIIAVMYLFAIIHRLIKR